MRKIFVLGIFISLFSQLQAQEPNDCVNAITVCGNGSFMSNATGIGAVQEVSGCGGFEHNSLWLEVNIVQSGTLGFDLIPEDPDILVDYDFWVYGPNRICSNLGSPIRCATTNPNEAGLANNHTGINGSTTLTQTGPGPNGNGYVYWLNVNVGETYYIVIDRPVGDGGFEIQWTGTATNGTGAFPSPPTANEIEDVKQCSSNPNIGIFDLNGLKNSINSDPGNTIEFYTSLADATDDINELPGIYANTSNPQQIFAKVKSGGTDCYTIIDFNLIVSPIPDATLSVSSNAICEGDNVTFTITGTPDATVHYQIDGGATQAVLLDASGTASITLSPASDTTLSLIDAQILSSTNTVVCSQALNESETVTISSNTVPTIVNNSPICEGEDGELQFSGDPDAMITYTVNSGANQTLTLDGTGNFTLTLPALLANTTIEIISVTSAVPPNCLLALNTVETIVVNPIPTVIAPNPLLACDDGSNPNTAAFDLDSQNNTISNNEANVTVTYFETQILAETGNPADALVSPYDSTSANQIVYVRVENIFGCVDYTTLNLQVVGAPLANIATPLQACDTNSQGFSIFDLTQAETEITAGNIQAVQVSYYELQAEAEAGTPQIANPTNYQNAVAYNHTIYVRVDSDATDCYNVAPLSLEVFDTPVISSVSALEVCDDMSNDEVAQFDLDSQTALILGGATDITVTYYISQTDAENGTGSLSSPYDNINNPQTIYVRSENDFNTDCYIVSTFDLIVNPSPTIQNPTPLEVCDDGTPDGITSIDLSLKNTEITGGNPNYSVSFHETQIDADNNFNPLPIPYTNTVNGQTVFVRVENNATGCYSTTTLVLMVQQAPIANTPTPLEYCDPDSDGFGVFDLTSKDIEITGGDPTLSVTYHETLANANNNVNPIASPYYNIVANTQTVFVRVESSTIATDCETIVELQIIVNPTPQLGAPPTPLEICDDSSADGFGQFDLTSKEAEILQNLSDPTLYTLSYYETQANAEALNNPIANPANYTNTTAFNQIIWVRVEDSATGCYKVTTLELIVNGMPVLIQPTALELCDVNNSGDEFETFTLEDASNEILNGQTGISLTYFETQVDADNNANPITSPYTNIVNPQTVFVRATVDTTGCVNTVSLLLRVNPIPSPTTPAPIEECDDDNDGFTSFDLETRTTEIIGGELDVAVTYHETQEDADTGNNALASPYTNIVVNQQILYIRVTNYVTGCYNASETLTIRVLESPEIPVSITDYVICDTNADGFAQFDLTTMNAEILGTQNPADFVLTYHLSQANAETGTNAIANVTNYTNQTNPQTIYIRLVSVANGCVTTGQFDIRVELPPTAVQPTPLEVCDDEVADEITVFDLTVKDAEITGGNASWSVSYYETNADAQAGMNAITPADAYTNTSIGGAPANPQTLYVVVTDTNTGCTDAVTLTLRVLPNPTPSTDPDAIALCDDTNTGDGQEVFDLTVNEVYIINGEAGVAATYHETQEDAEDGLNAIADPTQYTNIPTDYSAQTIYVRVTNVITGCYTIVTFQIQVNPLPEVVAVTDYIICELNNDGFAGFDLSTKDAEVLNGQDATIFVVTYHETQADADAEQNALVSPYTNTTNPQQIFVAITNTLTGCSISTQSFNIEVQEAAEANSDMVAILYQVCDDNMEFDGDPSNDSVQFDLATQDAAVLDGQDPLNYIVSYYETETDAELGVNPIPFLYENITNPQIIWARVDNDTLDGAGMDTSICYAVAELTLEVLPIPAFDLEDSYILCVDTNGSEVLEIPVLDTGLSETEYSFEWTLEGAILATETGSSLTPMVGGTYGVTVTVIATGCSSYDETEVIESAPPTLTVVVTTQAFSETHVIEATATGPGEYEYSLDNGAWQSSGVFTDVTTGVDPHVVTARDIIGCGETSEEVTLMDYPHYFTPNGDGYHDTWNIIGFANQPSAKIYIFDRYGKLLKQISPSGDGWNGTYNGNPMPTSDYWFIVEYYETGTANQNVRKEFKAHFTLKR